MLDVRKQPSWVWILSLTLFLAIAALACSGSPTKTPITESTPTLIPTSDTQLAGTTSPSSQPAGAESPPELRILSPRDGIEIESGAVRIRGKTNQDAVVAIDGGPVDVDADGRFYQDVALEIGANNFEVIVADFNGQDVFESVVVFSLSPADVLPFSLFYPPDGLHVSEQTIIVEGGTLPEAIVGINGTPVDINALGIFSQSVSLQEGANLLEVVATDFEDNPRFESVVVFYTP